MLMTDLINKIILKMSLQPPIAKGIIAAFDMFIEDLYKILTVSFPENFRRQTDTSSLSAFESAYSLFSNITEDSTEEDCLECVKSIQDLPPQGKFKFEKVTPLTDFYYNFRKLRNLIEQKLRIPLKDWKQAKQDTMTFPEVYGELVQELDDVRHAVEKARVAKDRMVMMPDEDSKREQLGKIKFAAEDFKSLQPFFTEANAEEHIERISALKNENIQNLENQLKDGEEAFQSSTLKYKKEIQNLIEETIKTKSFIEWLEVQTHFKLKHYEKKISEEWKRFSLEMEEGRKLGKVYKEKQAIYLEIEKERAERERQGKQDLAATIIQANWRGFMARRQLMEDFHAF